MQISRKKANISSKKLDYIKEDKDISEAIR